MDICYLTTRFNFLDRYIKMHGTWTYSARVLGQHAVDIDGNNPDFCSGISNDY
ncbi:hypothetical protein GCM10027155_15270 [Acinetobacter apis]